MIVNMAYVGVLAHLLRMDMDEVKTAIGKQFSEKVKAVEVNWRRPMPATNGRGKILNRSRISAWNAWTAPRIKS